jgi:ABC-2 type transport system ATP-binding protein
MVEDICTHVLILKAGQQMFFGSIGEVKEQFRQGSQTRSLEEIFFQATADQTSPFALLSQTAFSQPCS